MSRGARYRRWGALPLFVAIVGASLLGGCAGDGPSLPKITDLNPFKEKQQPLPGRRIPVIETTESITGNLADADKPIVLPALNANDAWPQPGGEPNNVPGNLALDGALRQMWAADVGEGSSKTGRVTASPIVFGGRIYALDAAANVTAFSLSGSKVFSVSTKPEGRSRPGWLRRRSRCRERTSLRRKRLRCRYRARSAVGQGDLDQVSRYSGARIADGFRRPALRHHDRWTVLSR